MKAKARITSSDVVALLRARYAPKAWAFLEQVGNATGFATSRHADGIAMSLWPSRGLEVHGFEVKVSRSDWTRELQAPDKADPIARYCDRWWVVVSEEAIIQPGELPATWGLMHVSGGKLVCKVEAPKLQPVPLDREFVAAVLRKSTEGLARTLADEFQRGRAAGIEAAPAAHERDWQREASELQTLRSSVAAFERASGVSLECPWLAGDIGRAVALALKVRESQRGGTSVAIARQQLKRVRDSVDTQIKALEALEKEVQVQLPGCA